MRWKYTSKIINRQTIEFVNEIWTDEIIRFKFKNGFQGRIK